ncbi:MAG: AI-2E family transporter [Bdellovibrio bacteriovorus]
MTPERVNKAVVLLLALGISALFLAMIWQFLLAILLAGIFAGLTHPLYARLRTLFGGRRHLAALATLVILAVVMVLPLGLLGSVLVAQTLDLSQSVALWLKENLEQPAARTALLERLPFQEYLAPHWETLARQAGEATTGLSKALVEGLSSVTLGAVSFVFVSFVFLYSLYFLLMDGRALLARILYYLPLQARDERLLLDRFTSVTRATLRGSLLVAILQGTLAGIAFAVAGIPNAVFWGSIMAILSTIPNVGAALVWVPAAGVLMIQGHMTTGIALAAFCALVVGSLDNVLRPILVGKDTQMHELLIFLSTLGGIFMFGFPGLFIGPVIASLFVSIWEIYGVEFADVLPEVDAAFAKQPTHDPVPDLPADGDALGSPANGVTGRPGAGKDPGSE